MLRLREWKRKINIAGEVLADEPLASHTTFRVGGPADLFARPANAADVAALLEMARAERIPWFVLGGGSNILVADRGVRGLVIDATSLGGIERDGPSIVCGSGAAMSDVSAAAADAGLGGLDFIYSMPGSVGGAVWMNARCYDGEIFDVLESVELVTPDGRIDTYLPDPAHFGYKRSPFMEWASIMTRVRFRLEPAERSELWRRMRDHEADRRSKGHFAAPCAGSVFKNNRVFGAPSGRIIDSIGMRGTQIGGARISDLHANIIINTGDATAADIRALIELVHERVLAELGFNLEREVLYVGDWGDDELQ